MKRGWLARTTMLTVTLLVGCSGQDGSAKDESLCYRDQDCTGTDICVVGRCVDAPSCSSHDDCEPGTWCDPARDVCRPGCRDKDDCGEGYVCQNGSCLDENQDWDGDGYSAKSDCDDRDPLVNPGATEVCNGIDDDCNGLVDEGLTSAPRADLQAGVCEGAVKDCGGKAGWIEPDYRLQAPAYEKVEESCDGLDNDCDGTVDEDLVPPPASKSEGVCAGAVKTCEGASGWTDPDFTLIPDYEPYETGACDGLDNDCDGMPDQSWDGDGDGYYSDATQSCVDIWGPQGLIDCDDDMEQFGADCVVYVNEKATGLNTGLSWQDALLSLQDALMLAKDNYEVWVAAGTYRPDFGVGLTLGNRNSTFRLQSKVSLYGGFAGTETSVDQRDWRSQITVLSGDLEGNDGADFENVGDNAFHVISVYERALLDGFWIVGGNASDHGGAVIAPGPSGEATFRNCTFHRNRAAQSGGAIYAYWSSSPTLINCRLIGNQAGTRGGAIYTNWSSEPFLYGCLFSGNTAGTAGGAVSTEWTGDAMLVINSTFANNVAPQGGAIALDWRGDAELVNNVLWGNGANPLFDGSFITDYTCIEGGALGTANTQITTDPFANSSGADNVRGTLDDDLHLKAGSPCANSGNNASVPTELTEDLDGNPRIQGTVDRGAYEGG